MKHVWLAALLLAGACASPPAPGQAAAEKKICRDQDKLGSLTPKRICETQAYWDAQEEKQAEIVKDTGRSVRANAATTRTSP
ncbi:MAG TPA: hypothetical protein VGO52_14510 [Hyphomonadaceae bacterium]|jgi:hypothetical protein|nr:hypothetical protein [Hyphomonadaceae bacterium]